jgi:Ni/Co efflux regulator RcnB
MRTLLLGAASLGLVLTATAASAQSYDGRYGGHQYYSGRTGQYAGRDSRWRQGQVYPYYHRRDRMISDWRAYHLPPPRAGYGYYYDDNGDVVMAALASGIIGMVIGGALANNGSSYGYQQPAYPYGYSNPYPYSDPYRYSSPYPYADPYRYSRPYQYPYPY